MPNFQGDSCSYLTICKKEHTFLTSHFTCILYIPPAIQNDVTKNTFPVFAKAAHKISLTDLLQHFSDEVLNHAIEVADELVEELFTRLTEKIQKEYLFHGA